MTFSSLLLAAALGQATVPDPVAAWRLSGTFVAEQAVYDARCAATIEEICRALGIEQEGFLDVRDGELRYLGGGECGELPFRAERVERDRAEGSFERPDLDGAPQKTRCAGFSCAGRRVQIWREGEALVLRGAIARLGSCGMPDDLGELETTVVRFVPIHRLKAAAAEQARRLGEILRPCKDVTLKGAGPPRRCWTGGAGLTLGERFEQVVRGMTTDEIHALLGPPNAVVGEKWHYGEQRPPKVGESLPAYVLTVRSARVVAKETLPGADATGPAPTTR